MAKDTMTLAEAGQLLTRVGRALSRKGESVSLHISGDRPLFDPVGEARFTITIAGSRLDALFDSAEDIAARRGRFAPIPPDKD